MTMKKLARAFASTFASSVAPIFVSGPRPYRNEAPASYRRGFHGVARDALGLRAVWVDERPGWSPESIRSMNARNGVGSSKIRKARAR